jgi:hypothetical protein
MIYYWLLWSAAILIEMLLCYYLIIGITNGLISGKSIRSWLILVCIPVSVLVLAKLFKDENQLCLANVVLGCLALPVLIIGAIVTYISNEKLN